MARAARCGSLASRDTSAAPTITRAVSRPEAATARSLPRRPVRNFVAKALLKG